MLIEKLTDHYASGDLLGKYMAGLEEMGAQVPVDPAMLAPGDEFHIGGREATAMLLGALKLGVKDKVLDLGCGVGGPARHIAAHTGADVTGIDLTPQFVEVGNALTSLCQLTNQVALHEGTVLELPFDTKSFDAAYMLHVGMNIADKPRLMAELARVVKPGGRVLIYDIVARAGEGELAYPVPWAGMLEHSYLADATTYTTLLEGAGFSIQSETDYRDFALDFFARMAAAQAKADGPPPIGLHLVLGADAQLKLGNMIAGIKSDLIGPVAIVAQRC